MKDFILIPSIINDIAYIHSQHLADILSKSEVQGNKIPLDFIRLLYKENPEKFFKVVDELSLRGFQFFTEKPNNILPNFTPDFSSYMEVESNHDYFKNLKLHRLGISGFIKRFNIDNDLFFNKIPLNGFTFMNASIDQESLMDELKSAGFEIKTTQASPADKPQTEYSSTSDPEPRPYDNNVRIDQAFEDSKYNTFRRFCYQNKLKTIGELTPDHINTYKNAKGVGVQKFQLVKERLKSYQIGEVEPTDPEDRVVKLENKIAGEVEPKQILFENKFTLFVTFCEENGLKTINEIKKKHITAFSNRPQVGAKKVRDVENALTDFAKTADSSVPTFFTAGNLLERIQYMDVVDLLESYGFNSGSNSALKIVDIEGEYFADLVDVFDPHTLIQLSNKLKNQKSPQLIASDTKNALTEKELKVLELRFIDKVTLETAGQQFSVTRERVRQIERKAIRKVSNHLTAQKFVFIIKLLAPNKSFITSNEFIDFIGTDNAYLLNIFKAQNDLFSYYEELDVFFFPEAEKDKIINKLEEIFTDLPDIFYFHEYENLLEESLENVGINIDETGWKTILENFGFQKFGKAFSRSKITMLDILEQLFKKHIKGSLRIDDDAVVPLNELSKRYFDSNLGDSARAIEARLRYSRDVLLVGKNTFQWFDHDHFDESLMKDIDTYMKQQFEYVPTINVAEIFEVFAEKLAPFKITNKLHLYSLIRYYLGDEYSIGKGNTLNIFLDDENKLNIEDTVIATVKNLGGTCTKEELEKMLRWQRYKIDLAISSSDKLIPWGTNKVKLFDDLQLSDEQVSELSKLVESSLKEGYTTTSIIFEEMLFNKKLSPVIHEKGIDENGKLSAIIKILNPTIRGHMNFLYHKDSTITSFEEAIAYRFTGETPREEIKRFIIEHGYKELMASIFLERIVEQDYFVEIDLGIYYPTNNFTIPEEAVTSLTSLIESRMGENGFISLSNLEGYKGNLPSISFRWNPYLMKSILLNHGYRHIKKEHHDYRYDQIILVKNESKIDRFEELIHHILMNEYKGNMHESTVYDFLATKGIVRKKDYIHEKTLPYEVRKESKLVNVDELGIVTVRQVEPCHSSNSI
ncbi:sigma factor-like helix-turn-helix DNA-binding protein [Virgibacillus byunsanensis]|uniref:Sigma factor-like helix-turn-helix DNA-binding protein n=1 Tax=Virgibacillus byunsanensis TaxID=570945 RepID=A0ABW3LN64_9BACI